MVNTGTVRTAIGIVGNVISMFLFLSPLPTFIKIIKQKSVQQFKPDPYIATLLNCALWFFYGLPFIKTDSTLVLTINGAGLVIELIFVAIFFIYSTWPKRRIILLALLVEVIFVAAVVIITMLCFHTAKKRAFFVGILCIILNIIMYAAPLTVMRMVIKTRSVEYMPFFLSLMNFCNGIVWTVYSLLRFDINILIPNSLGTLSGLVQLILYAIYCKSSGEKDKNNLEMRPVDPRATENLERGPQVELATRN